MVRIITLLLVGCALVLASVRSSSAQDATPAAGVVPDPADCQVEPRAMEELIAIWAEAATPTDGAMAATPTAAGTPFTGLPAGEPADAATVEAVTATVHEVFACFNAGDFRRALSLFSDNLVASFGPEPGTEQAEIEAFLAATPTPMNQDQLITLVRVFNVVVLDDGRVAAVVVSIDPSTGIEGELTDLAYFVEEEGQWLVDEVIEGIPPIEPMGSPVATPGS